MPIVALILSNLPTIIEAGQAGWELVMKIRESLKQSNEWTDEAEALYQDKLSKMATEPQWQPDSKLNQ